VNFKNSQRVKKQFNKWVSKTTNGLINEFDIDISPDTKMVLSSTIYFKGKWLFGFNSTKSQFTLPSGVKTEVEAMQIKKKYHSGTFSNIKATWAAIPYNSTEAMVVILPDEQEDIESIIDDLKGKDFVDIIETITGYKTDNWLNITMPKFKLNSFINLKKPLEKVIAFEI
jgi:serine protease inhibitor